MADSSKDQAARVAAGRVEHWLLTGPPQQVDGTHRGAVAGWVGPGGRADYVYPEITGYYLQWLASIASRYEADVSISERARGAARWIHAWSGERRAPPTRVYLRDAPVDWRNDAVFCFDVAMVLRGLASATRAGLVLLDAATVSRLCEWLDRMIGADGQFDACIVHAAGASLPERWSTRRGAFLAKAAAGIIDAARWLPGVPGRVHQAAMRTFTASIGACIDSPHCETHPFLYAIEGYLALPQHPSFAPMLPQVSQSYEDLMARVQVLDRVPETSDDRGIRRRDIVAQLVRAGVLLDAHDGGTRMSRLARFRDALAEAVDAQGAMAFVADAAEPQFNVWTAMFTAQALELAGLTGDALRRRAADPCIV